MNIKSEKLFRMFKNIETFTKGYKGMKLINIRVKDRMLTTQISVGSSTLVQTIPVEEDIDFVQTVIQDNSYSKLFAESEKSEIIVTEKMVTMSTETMTIFVENKYNEVSIKTFRDLSETKPLHSISFTFTIAFKNLAKDYATIVDISNNKMTMLSSVAMLSIDTNYDGPDIQLTMHNFKLLKEFYSQLSNVQMNEESYKFIGDNMTFICKRQFTDRMKIDSKQVKKICNYKIDTEKLKVLSQFKVDIINLLINSYYLKYESITEMTFEQQTDISNYSLKEPMIKLKVNLKYLLDAFSAVNGREVSLGIYEDAYLIIDDNILLPIIIC